MSSFCGRDLFWWSYSRVATEENLLEMSFGSVREGGGLSWGSEITVRFQIARWLPTTAAREKSREPVDRFEDVPLLHLPFLEVADDLLSLSLFFYSFQNSAKTIRWWMFENQQQWSSVGWPWRWWTPRLMMIPDLFENQQSIVSAISHEASICWFWVGRKALRHCLALVCNCYRYQLMKSTSTTTTTTTTTVRDLRVQLSLDSKIFTQLNI